MKIHLLPMGARFELDGEEYVKTGPMLATGKSGQRFIPKYTLLKPLGEGASPAPAASGTAPTPAAVLEAFDAFYANCQTLVPAERHAELDAARAAFLAALG